MELEMDEAISAIPTEIIQRRVKQARLLLVAGVLVFGLSYPLTVLFNSIGWNHAYPLYISVTLGSVFMVWGMAKYFGE